MVFSILSDHLCLNWEKWKSGSHTHTHTHTHSSTHTTHILNVCLHTHADMSRLLYRYIYTHTYAQFTTIHMPTRTYMYLNPLIFLPWYAYTHIYIYAHTHISTSTTHSMYAYTHIHVDISKPTHTHIYIYIYTHWSTCNQICTHIYQMPSTMTSKVHSVT